MKKGEGVKKAAEAIYKLALNKAFRNEVIAIRTKHGTSLLDSVKLLEKYKLPPSYYWEMHQYVMHGRIGDERDPESQIASIKYPNDPKLTTGDEQTFEKLRQPYVGIYVHDASSEHDVKKLIGKNWQRIRASLQVQGGNVSRIRTSENKERNLLISALGEKTKDKLCDEANIPQHERKGMYKEMAIARLMNEKYGHPEVTFEVVKKYLSRPTDKSQHKRSIKS